MTARITPYEIVLAPLERSAFPAIRAEADQRGSDTRRRDQFLLLGSAGAALREMIPDDAPAEAIDEYGELLYQGYQFWSFGRRLYAFGPDITTRITAESTTLGDWTLAGPPAAYLQFPYQLLWARVSAEAPFEPVDGCFVVLDETLPAPSAGAHLRVQLVLGLRRDRPGISLVSYRTDLDPTCAARQADTPWREAEAPFANAIPGGERKGYRTIATTSELEALVIRALAWLDRNSRTLQPREGSTVEGESALPYIQVGSG